MKYHLALLILPLLTVYAGIASECHGDNHMQSVDLEDMAEVWSNVVALLATSTATRL